MADDKKVKFQATNPMDKKLMEKIGWSEGDVESFLFSYSTFEDDEKDEQQQQKKQRSRVEKVEMPHRVRFLLKTPDKAAAAAKMDEGVTVVENV